MNSEPEGVRINNPKLTWPYRIVIVLSGALLLMAVASQVQSG